MQSGKLRHKVTIERKIETKSTTGAVAVTWETFTPIWASIETLKAYEKAASAGTWPKADVKVCCRYKAGVLPTMRVVYRGIVYSILGINNIEERNRELELICETGVKLS